MMTPNEIFCSSRSRERQPEDHLGDARHATITQTMDTYSYVLPSMGDVPGIAWMNAQGEYANFRRWKRLRLAREPSENKVPARTHRWCCSPKIPACARIALLRGGRDHAPSPEDRLRYLSSHHLRGHANSI